MQIREAATGQYSISANFRITMKKVRDGFSLFYGSTRLKDEILLLSIYKDQHQLVEYNVQVYLSCFGKQGAWIAQLTLKRLRFCQYLSQPAGRQAESFQPLLITHYPNVCAELCSWKASGFTSHHGRNTFLYGFLSKYMFVMQVSISSKTILPDRPPGHDLKEAKTLPPGQSLCTKTLPSGQNRESKTPPLKLSINSDTI